MRSLLCISVCLLVVSSGVAQDKKPAEPKSKEAAVKLLNDFLAAIEAKDYKKAAAFYISNPDFDTTDPEKACKTLLERKEISKKGIEILAAKGKWGNDLENAASDRARERVKRKAAEFKVAPEGLYGLALEKPQSFALFFWNGKEFKILKLDDIGRLD